MVEWIKVENKLPEDERYCLCATLSPYYGKGIAIGFYTDRLGEEYNGEKRWVIANEVNEDVVAWAEFNNYKYE